jgi:type I restriction enzyme, S subunit
MGQLPEGWRLIRLSDAGAWFSGGTPPTDDRRCWGGEIPWISATSLKNFRIVDSERRITGLGICAGIRLVPAGTVVFVVRGMSLKNEFRIGVARVQLAFGQDCKAIVPAAEIDGTFLGLAIDARASQVLGMVDEAGHGTGRLPTDLISRLEIAIPPMAAQRRIVQVFDDLDGQIAVTSALIRKLADLRSATLIESVSLERARQLHWPEIRLTDISTLGGKYGSGAAAIPYDPALPRYVRITDIGSSGGLLHETRASITWAIAKPYILHQGDLLFARSGATVGKTYLYQKSDGPCAHASYVIKFTINSEMALPEYVSLWTQTPFYWHWVKQTLRQGAQPNINASEYGNHRLPLPPLEEQDRITKSVRVWDMRIERQIKLLTKIQLIRQGLLDELLTV